MHVTWNVRHRNKVKRLLTKQGTRTVLMPHFIVLDHLYVRQASGVPTVSQYRHFSTVSALAPRLGMFSQLLLIGPIVSSVRNLFHVTYHNTLDLTYFYRAPCVCSQWILYISLPSFIPVLRIVSRCLSFFFFSFVIYPYILFQSD